jgi:hypothetical protein
VILTPPQLPTILLKEQPLLSCLYAKFPTFVWDMKLGVYFSVAAIFIKHAYHKSLDRGHLNQAEFHHLARFQGGAANGIIF